MATLDGGGSLVQARPVTTRSGALQVDGTYEAGPVLLGRLPRHLPALDGLRGIAILVVLVNTLSALDPLSSTAARTLSRVTDHGWTGVQLFFVLSGFLITGILLDSRYAKNYFSAFYARRTLRIFPLYFGVLFVAFIVLPVLGAAPPIIIQDQPNQLWLWTYTANWGSNLGHPSVAFPHFWSLAVEEQFYLVWPFLIRRQTPSQCFRFCIAVAVVSLVVRTVLVAMDAPALVIYQNSFCRMDALAMGGAAAAAFRVPGIGARLAGMHRRIFLGSAAVAVVGLIVTGGFWYDTTVGATIGYTIAALMFALWLTAAASADTANAVEPSIGSPWWARAMRVAPLRAVGKVSYAMYVFQYPLNHYVGRPIASAAGLDFAHSVVASIAYTAVLVAVIFVAALASWHLFEKRFLDLKRHFVPSLPQPEIGPQPQALPLDP
jgi:peptidoglycan/LPS O-acetylase OafA/YrhL